jgi:hypothetical protein
VYVCLAANHDGRTPASQANDPAERRRIEYLCEDVYRRVSRLSVSKNTAGSTEARGGMVIRRSLAFEIVMSRYYYLLLLFYIYIIVFIVVILIIIIMLIIIIFYHSS